MGKDRSRDLDPGGIPRSPTGRVPQWVVDEASGRAPQHGVPWRADFRPTVDLDVRSTRRRRRRGILAALAVSLLVGSGVWAVSTGRPWALTATPPWAPPVREAPTAAVDHPTPGREAAAHPLGTPPTLAMHSTSYRFARAGEGEQSFVGYDPCRPVHYVVRPQGAPAGSSVLVAQAIARMSETTGLVFVDDGTTTEAPTAVREPFQPDLYGDRWAPVLIAWVSPDESPDLAGDVAGRAGSTAVGLPEGPQVYVTGQVELDGAQLAEMMTRPGGTEIARAVIQHELAHVVGLDHVNDPSQLMHPEGGPAVTDFGAGDLTGLGLLGRGPCEPGL